MSDAVGAMRERLVVQQNAWPALKLTALTRSGTTATGQTVVPHGYQAGEYVTVAGASIAGYNGKVAIGSVPSTTAFTYPVESSLGTPTQTGITATYASDAQGGRRANWTTLATIWAALAPLSGAERLQLATVQAIVNYQFRVRVRTDLSPTMRVAWTPRWPPGAPTRALEINAVTFFDDPWSAGMRYQLLQCAEVAI